MSHVCLTGIQIKFIQNDSGEIQMEPESICNMSVKRRGLNEIGASFFFVTDVKRITGDKQR